jgi:hypothetical protein
VILLLQTKPSLPLLLSLAFMVVVSVGLKGGRQLGAVD